MSNSALRPQIGVSDVESIINTHDTNIMGGTGVTKVSQAPVTNANWTNLTSGSAGASVDGALKDAGFILCKFEFSSGSEANVRIPCFSTS